ncbi:MAG: hypothetical protein A2W91_03770 [Bacteroidetes bacterium GWF2_38_335]|nr:MAG: hypothetical protein A2W91_03770 [Bacteroidetes bacterium GWF2_38_335]HBS87314.1 hypothetical protein [Bacteroidales bacterium]
MMKKIILFNFVMLLSSVLFSQETRTDSLISNDPCVIDKNLFKCRLNNDSVYRSMIIDSSLILSKCHEMSQVIFWRSIMNLHEDSAIMNEKDSRFIMDKIPISFFKQLSDSAKENYKDSLRMTYGFPDTSRVLFSTGKKFFYKFENLLPSIDTSIAIFTENGVDPWYAQSILLIESPAKLQKSTAGAYGPFQLMKGVAKKYGLVVNGYVDERRDLKRSAYAASQLIKRICIPSARTMMDTLGITYNECDIWFRLLVMHVYHAGAGNVKAALEVIKPTSGGLDLIKQLWITDAAKFKNSSQNYSQVILAAQFEFISMVVEEYQSQILEKEENIMPQK